MNHSASAYRRRASECVAEPECSGFDARTRVQAAQCVRVREPLLRLLRRALASARARTRQQRLAQLDRLLQHAPVVRHALTDAVYAYATRLQYCSTYGYLKRRDTRQVLRRQAASRPKRRLHSGNRFRGPRTCSRTHSSISHLSKSSSITRVQASLGLAM